jgi:hypothetical protein
LEALEERRMFKVRHARYNAALVASAVYGSAAGEWVDPLEFVPGFETDPETLEARRIRKDIVHSIRLAFCRLPKKTPVAEVLARKDAMIARLKANGHEDAEALMLEAFPNLKG